MRKVYYKTYKVIANDEVKGYYTTIDGCHAAAKRRGLNDYDIKQISGDEFKKVNRL